MNADGYGIVDARDGYLLLRRGAGMEGADNAIPESFYSFAYVDSLANVNRVDATFAGGLRLVGYQITPRQIYRSEPELTITTYWTVSQPISAPLTVVMTLAPPYGPRLVFADSHTQEWLPPSAWAPNHLIRMQTWPIYFDANGPDAYTLGVEVRDGAPGEHPAVSASVAVTLASAAGADRFPQVAQNSDGVLLTVVPLR